VVVVAGTWMAQERQLACRGQDHLQSRPGADHSCAWRSTGSGATMPRRSRPLASQLDDDAGRVPSRSTFRAPHAGHCMSGSTLVASPGIIRGIADLAITKLRTVCAAAGRLPTVRGPTTRMSEYNRGRGRLLLHHRARPLCQSSREATLEHRPSTPGVSGGDSAGLLGLPALGFQRDWHQWTVAGSTGAHLALGHQRRSAS